VICAVADLGNAAQRLSGRESGQQIGVSVLVSPRTLSGSATLENAVWIHDALWDPAAVVMRSKVRWLSLKERLIRCMTF